MKIIILLILIISVANAAILTWDEFSNAVQTFGPPPQTDQYNAFNNRITSAGGITTKLEAAMFLTQILWESIGLKYKRELRCASDGCAGNPGYDKSVGVPGKEYYGRGYIQLTHSYNYKAASLALFNDDRLIKNPDLVADNEDVAWATAFWYWKIHVHNVKGVAQGLFGATTNAVIGAWECKDHVQRGHQRFELYKRVLEAVNINPATANEHGCYN